MIYQIKINASCLFLFLTLFFAPFVSASDFLINSVTLTDDNGGSLLPGDTMTFCVTVECAGSGTCQNTSVGWVNTQNNTTPSSGTFTAIPTPLNMSSPPITACTTIAVNLNTANQQIIIDLTGDGRCNGPGGNCNPTTTLVSNTITPVTLSSLSSESMGERVMVNWTTSSELFNLGFQLWGLDGADRSWKKLHGWLVRSGSGNAVEPQSYSKTLRIPTAIDSLIALGISSMDNDGSEHYYGPFDVGKHYGNLSRLEPVAWNQIRRQVDVQMASRGYIKDRLHGYRKSDAVIDVNSPGAGDQSTGSETMTVVEFKVSEPGIYRLTAQDLLATGVDWHNIAKRDIALIDYHGEAVVRYIAAKGEGNGQARALGVDGEIYFHARGVDNVSGLYGNSSVYRLVIDHHRALNAQFQRKRGIQGGDSDYYYTSNELENDNRYSLNSGVDDPWLDTVVVSYEDQTASYATAVPVDADAMWDHDAKLTLKLARSSALTPVDADLDGIQDIEHNVEAVILSPKGVGGLYTLGTDHAIGSGPWTPEFTIPGGTPLTLIDDKLVVGGIFNAGAGYSTSEVQVDAVQIRYARPYTARLNQDYLAFTAPDDGALAYSVTVPDTGWPLVFAYNESGALVRVGLESQQKKSTFTGTQQRLVRFAALAGAAQHTATVQYWVSGKRGLLSVQSLTAKSIASRSSLLTQAKGAELLLVAHPAFMTQSLYDYAQFKHSKGIAATVINYLDVVDIFGGGQTGPRGLTRFLSELRTQSSELAQVLLVGGSSYDHTDKLGTGAITFIPGHYGKSAYSNYTVTDAPYVTDKNGNLIAGIGRWPVRSIGDLDAIIASSMTWSMTDHTQGSALVIAENTVEGEDINFASALDSITQQLPISWKTHKVYVDEIRTNEPNLNASQVHVKVKQQIVGHLKAGAQLVMFNGHGTTSQLSNEGLLKASEIADINDTATRSQLWLPLSCYVTYFESTHMNTLAHQLLFSGKAVGITGAMLLSNQEQNIAAGTSVLNSVFEQGLSIGEAVKTHKTAKNNPGLTINFNHLGDPTLKR